MRRATEEVRFIGTIVARSAPGASAFVGGTAGSTAADLNTARDQAVEKTVTGKMPAQVLTTTAAYRHLPAIRWKPGKLGGGDSVALTTRRPGVAANLKDQPMRIAAGMDVGLVDRDAFFHRSKDVVATGADHNFIDTLPVATPGFVPCAMARARSRKHRPFKQTHDHESAARLKLPLHGPRVPSLAL